MIIYIIIILCYAPSVFTCIVGGAIQMTVYIYIYIFCSQKTWPLFLIHTPTKPSFKAINDQFIVAGIC